MSEEKLKGSLTCVGVGISIGAHISPIVRTTIQSADVVFAASSDGLFELWLQDIHPNVVSLQQYYATGKSRKISYQEMADALLNEVRNGKKVVGAFYGHPGVFVNPSHKAIKKARDEGYEAKMLPGISAEDCLYADLGIDPGKYGCQHYEASQFMFYKRIVDTSAYLILWQLAFAGDNSHTITKSDKRYLEILKTLLLEHYSSQHHIIIYEAPTNELNEIIKKTIPLAELVEQTISMKSTLIIPPARELTKNNLIHNQLKNIDLLQPI
ncbi:SAM-dependent methyltransferase [Pleionea mediterranea]|uniref:Tetrapyrrole (Corrin/porphyrin) methylase-like protein n=1 Tax=Pleionea mediterranea TaxID=523701 RepID=A0A316FZZ0_9GAMM|nr:SAM-dependent methyltransferase [Pleionea mediterranea]PWK54211.1 tetrapyrrole (corrin/porphyrin) methylase-like protein [Pleionea mediterranea]